MGANDPKGVANYLSPRGIDGTEGTIMLHTKYIEVEGLMVSEKFFLSFLPHNEYMELNNPWGV